MSGWTTTFDASHKVHAGDKKHQSNFIKHIARDVWDKNGGQPVHYDNVNIDRSRSANNVTMVNDGQGGYAPCQSIDQITDFVDGRLSQLKKQPNKNVVVFRPIVFALDNDYIEAEYPDWKTDESQRQALMKDMQPMIDFAAKEFGQENIPGYSFHFDEEVVQLQLMLMPIKDDVLSQTKIFTGPKSLSDMHQRLRQDLISNGYEASLDVLPTHKKSRSNKEYFREMRELDAALEEFDGDIRRKIKKVRAKESVVEAKAKWVSEGLTDIEAQADALADAREKLLELQRQAEQQMQELVEDLQEREAKVQAEQEGMLKARLALLDATAKQDSQMPREFIARQGLTAEYEAFRQEQLEAVERVMRHAPSVASFNMSEQDVSLIQAIEDMGRDDAVEALLEVNARMVAEREREREKSRDMPS